MGQLQGRVVESAVVPGERGRYVTRRAALPDFNPHERAAYALWSREAKEAADAADRARVEELRQRDPAGMGRMVLTENGWEVPTGPLNPRIIEHETTLPTPYEAALEAAIQAQVQHVAGDHEHAVKSGDMWEFQRMYRTWELPIRFYYDVL